MKNQKSRRILIIGIVLTMMLLTFTGCSNNASNKADEDSKALIRVGAKHFTENEIMAEIYALALEDAGYEVERIMNIAGSVIHTSIINDEIDLYPEYTGTGLISILKMDLLKDPDEVYQTVKEEYKKQFDIVWLDYSQANDSQGIFVSKEISDEYGIKTISDLQKNADKVRFATQGDFDERQDALPNLENIYGEFNWKSSKLYDNGLKYTIVGNDEADAAPAYTTEGMLSKKDQYVLLEDDKYAWPPYNITPIIQAEVLEENPEIEEILNKVSATMDTETITKLNAQVDVDKNEFEEVAREYWEKIKVNLNEEE